MIPSLISGCPNFAVSDAIIMSHIMANSHPPPSANPETAAISGFRRAATRGWVGRPQRHAGGDIADIGDRSGHDLAARCKVFDQLARQDHEVRNLARQDSVAHAADGTEISGQALAGRSEDVAGQRLGQTLCRPTAQDFQHGVPQLMAAFCAPSCAYHTSTRPAT
jgi:hypothetical protein